MTFDLHCSNEEKSENFKAWVKRIYLVSSTLNLNYSELWDLPEQEFMVLEGISDEVTKAKKEMQQKLQATRGKG